MKLHSSIVSSLLASSLLLPGSPAHAAPESPEAPRVNLDIRDLPQRDTAPGKSPYVDRTFRYDLRWELPVTGTLLGFWAGSEIAKAHISPAVCRFCGKDPAGVSQVNALDLSVRNAFRIDNAHAAGVASDVLGFGALPAAMLTLNLIAAVKDGGLRQWAVDAMIIAEATALTGSLTQIAKFTVGRERPYLHDASAGDRAKLGASPEDNLSFFSGHTSFVFALAVSSGTVASMRGYRMAPAIWAAGLGLAATTAYLRMAADKHYFTDVLTGAAIGSAVGFVVPWLHKKRVQNHKIPDLGGGRLPGGGAYVTATWQF